MLPLPIPALITIPFAVGMGIAFSSAYRVKPRRERVAAFMQCAIVTFLLLLGYNWLIG